MLILLEVDFTEEVEVFPEGGGFASVNLELYFYGFCCNIDSFVVKCPLPAVKLGKDAIDGNKKWMDVS